MTTSETKSVERRWLAAFILSLIVGILGIDRFYLGKTGTGLVKLLTLGGCGIWYLIDFILIATKSMPGVEWVDEQKNDKRTAWIVFAIFILLSIISGAISGTSLEVETNNDTGSSPESSNIEPAIVDETPAENIPTDTPTVNTETTTEVEPEPEAVPSLSIAQQNAVRSAESYLDFSGFSKQGLIDQLVFEEYLLEDATLAVNSLSVDWNAEAAESAKSYLEYSSFSCQGLIDQLVFEDFTAAEANFGAGTTGLCE